ncbi:hypothetical protein N7520_010523 [Penicillium odoratum]|uniref:uncharacterized protein n=1 Tax=Penicillium odoratum TaxID=1167516 RepID=UPI0025490B43|nr:uncharacterized protein N7520_010523 [Penicillium odoratum]KAJ5745341.1 hypothetical protein N7520_010523 [Penicillium odoratum]
MNSMHRPTVLHARDGGKLWYIHEELERAGLSVVKIVEVQAEIHPLVVDLTGKMKPKHGLEAKFSVHHGGAVRLLLGKSTPVQYENEVVTNS